MRKGVSFAIPKIFYLPIIRENTNAFFSKILFEADGKISANTGNKKEQLALLFL